MESQSVVLGLLIAALSLLVVLWPFIGMGRRDEAQAGSPALDSLVEQREAIYAALRDLDFDYETGKLTEEDYHAQREVWVRRGVNTLKALDVAQQAARPSGASIIPQPPEGSGPSSQGDAESVDAQIEAAIAERRHSGRQSA